MHHGWQSRPTDEMPFALHGIQMDGDDGQDFFESVYC